jgi:hypothetical protein
MYLLDRIPVALVECPEFLFHTAAQKVVLQTSSGENCFYPINNVLSLHIKIEKNNKLNYFPVCFSDYVYGKLLPDEILSKFIFVHCDKKRFDREFCRSNAFHSSNQLLHTHCSDTQSQPFNMKCRSIFV